MDIRIWDLIVCSLFVKPIYGFQNQSEIGSRYGGINPDSACTRPVYMNIRDIISITDLFFRFHDDK